MNSERTGAGVLRGVHVFSTLLIIISPGIPYYWYHSDILKQDSIMLLTKNGSL